MASNKSDNNMHQELSSEHHDPLIRVLHGIIRICVKALSVLMLVVIVWGVADVAYVLYDHLSKPPVFLLNVSDIFKIFGAFMVVLIATALMAIARKVIILDLEKIQANYILAIAAVVPALGVTYWLIGKSGKTSIEADTVG